MRGVLALAALAGLGGIGSEIVWLRVVEHTAGHMPLGAALTVACFIAAGGLGALWARRVRRPQLIPLASGAIDLVLALALGHVMAGSSAVLAALAPRLGLELASALVGVALTVVPAFLAGAVVPVLMEAAGEGGRAYGAHALGAVVGVLGVELVLHPRLGLTGCLVGLVGVHGATALGLWRARAPVLAASSAAGPSASLAPPAPPAPRASPARPVAWLALVGVGTGAVQGGWLACAPLLAHPFAFVAPAVVASMLLGLHLGARLWRRTRATFDAVLLAVLLGGALALALLAAIARTTLPASPWATAFEVVAVVLPAAIPIGAVVPAFLDDDAAVRARAGAALAAISLGNALGLTAVTAVVTAFVPAPWVVVAGLALAGLAVRARRPTALALLSVAALLAAVTGDRVLIARAVGTRADHVELEQLFRAPGAVSAIFRADGLRRLYQTGYPPIDLGARSESLIGAVGAAYAPRYQRALVIGAGSGRTAGTVALMFKAVDVVDLDPNTEALCRALATENNGLLGRANVRLHRFDGLLAPFVLEPGYDLIVQTVDPAYHALAAKLYTVEHLTRLRGLLAPDGVLLFWSDATLSPRANQVLVNTGAAVFPHQKLFSAFGGLQRGLGVSYYFLVHGAEPLRYQPRSLRFLFGDDAQVRALPQFGGFPPGDIAGVAPSSLDLEPPPLDRSAPDRWRLIDGRFDATTAIHRAERPDPDILFGGTHTEELAILPR